MFKLKKSCWNCQRSIGYRQEAIPQTYWEPGEPAMIEDCNSPSAVGDNWDNWTDEYEDSDRHNELEEFIADKCPDYVPETCQCENCKKEMNIIDTTVLNSIYDFVYTCSKECATIVHEKIEEEIRESLED